MSRLISTRAIHSLSIDDGETLLPFVGCLLVVINLEWLLVHQAGHHVDGSYSAVMETGSVTLWHSLLLLLLLWSSLSSSQSSLVLWTYFPVHAHERFSIIGLEHSPHRRGTNIGRKAKRTLCPDRPWREKKCLWIVTVSKNKDLLPELSAFFNNVLKMFYSEVEWHNKTEVNFLYPWEVFQSDRTQEHYLSLYWRLVFII